MTMYGIIGETGVHIGLLPHQLTTQHVKVNRYPDNTEAVADENGNWVIHRTIDDYKQMLLDIDIQSARPIRAKLVGTATEYDDEVLRVLETKAQDIRAIIAELG